MLYSMGLSEPHQRLQCLLFFQEDELSKLALLASFNTIATAICWWVPGFPALGTSPTLQPTETAITCPVAQLGGGACAQACVALCSAGHLVQKEPWAGRKLDPCISSYVLSQGIGVQL